MTRPWRTQRVSSQHDSLRGEGAKCCATAGGSDDNKHTGLNNVSPWEQPHELNPEVASKEESHGNAESSDGANSTTHEPGDVVNETEGVTSNDKQSQAHGGSWQIPGGWLVSVLDGLRASIRGAAS